MSLIFIQPELLNKAIGRKINDIQIFDENRGFLLLFEDGGQIAFNGGISEFKGKSKPWGSVAASDGELEMKHGKRFNIFGENVQTHPPAGGEQSSPENLTNQPTQSEPETNGGLGDVSCSALVDGPNAYTYALDVCDDLKHHDEKMSKRYQNALKSGKMKPEEVLFWCFKTLHLLHFPL